MRELPQSFPTFRVAVTVLFAVAGVWLIFRRSRRRVDDKLRCPECDYILTGICSDRCPECGTPIDPRNVALGCRRRSGIRIVAGLVVLALGLYISWTPVARWWPSIYWYQYRPTASVLEDLKHGSGRPPPPNNPLERNIRFTHGWAMERVDLARAALDELLHRDTLGILSTEQRRQLDQVELTTETGPFTTPVQFHLRTDLFDRASARKLTVEDQTTFDQRIIALNLKSRPRIIRGDRVPLRITYRTANFPYPWEIVTTLKSVRVDGRPTNLLPKSPNQWLAGGWDLDDDRQIECTSLGRHQLEVDVLFDVHPLGRDHYIIHSETRTLTTWFQVTPSSAIEMIKLIDNPKLTSAIQNSIAVEELRYHVWEPGDVFGMFDVRPTPVSFAFDVYARFRGREWPIGHIAHAASAARERLRVDSDYKNCPLPDPPDRIDVVLRSSRKIASTTLDLYDIWSGEIVLKDVPIPKRRGP